MSSTIKSTLIFALVMVPMILLIEYATHHNHLTLMQGFRAVCIQAVGFFLTQRLMRSITKRQAKQKTKRAPAQY